MGQLLVVLVLLLQLCGSSKVSPGIDGTFHNGALVFSVGQWEVSFQLQALSFVNVSEFSVLSAEERMYDRGKMVESIRRRDGGLKHSFLLYDGPSEPFSMDIAVTTGSLSTSFFSEDDSGRNTLAFFNGSSRVFTYSELIVYDGEGGVVPSRFTWDADRHCIRFFVLLNAATKYPLDIDPLAEVPAVTLDGTSEMEEFGYSFDVGDVNGDGLVDLAVGSPGFNTLDGKVTLCMATSSSDRIPSCSSLGTGASNSRYGYSVAFRFNTPSPSSPQMLLASAPNEEGNNGRTRIHAVSGSTLQTRSAASVLATGGSNRREGIKVAWSDVTRNNGLPDAVVNSPMHSYSSCQVGSTAFYDQNSASPRTGQSSRVYNMQGIPLCTSGPGNQYLDVGYGTNILGRADFNGDGIQDVVVNCLFTYGGPDNDRPFRGSVSVYAGKSGSSGPDAEEAPVWTVLGDEGGMSLGWSMAACDVNGDGRKDLVIGAPTASSSSRAEDAGRVFIFHSTASGLPAGATLASADLMLEGTGRFERFGWALACADIKKDGGAEDLLIGAPGVDNDKGRVYVYHGTPSGLSATPDSSVGGGAEGSQFGHTIVSGLDWDDDGWTDAVIGAPYYKRSDGREVGRVTVHYGIPFADSSVIIRATAGNFPALVANEDTTFTVDVVSAGPGEIPSHDVRIPLPKCLLWTSGGSGCTHAAGIPGTSGSSGVVSCSSSTPLASGDTNSFTFTARGNPSANGECDVTATLSTTAANRFGVQVDTYTVSIELKADLRITAFTAAKNSVRAGDRLNYTFSFTNDGPSDSIETFFELNLEDSIPGTSLVAVTFEIDGVPQNPLGKCFGELSCFLGTLSAGVVVTGRIEVKVNSGFTSEDMRAIFLVTTGSLDENLADNSRAQSPVTTVAVICDLVSSGITNTPSVVVEAGSLITYNAIVSNRGPSDSVDVVYKFNLPTNTMADLRATVPSHISDPPNSLTDAYCDVVADGATEVTCYIPRIRAGSTAQISLPFTVLTGVPSGDTVDLVRTSTAPCATGSVPDADVSNNCFTGSLSVPTIARADVAVSVFTPANIYAGAFADLNIILTNLGPSDAFEVVYTVLLPRHTDLDSRSIPEGCTSNTVVDVTEVSCTVPQIIGREERNVIFRVNVPSDFVVRNGEDRNVEFTAEITSTESTDDFPSNDQATIRSLVRNGDAQLTVLVNNTIPDGIDNPIVSGGPFSIITLLSNIGTVRASEPLILSPTPAGVDGATVVVARMVPGVAREPPTFVEETVVCTIGADVTCPFTAIEAKTTYTITFSGTVNVPETTKQTLRADVHDPYSGLLKSSRFEYNFLVENGGLVDEEANEATRKKNQGAVIGGIIAGVLFILLLALLLWKLGFFKRKRPEEILEAKGDLEDVDMDDAPEAAL